MNIPTLRGALTQAEDGGFALGHFNVATLEMFHAVVHAVKEANVPAIIGVSEGERDFMGVREITDLVSRAREEGVPVYLNADHTYSVSRAIEAIDAGYDAVIFDGAKLSFEENVSQTKEVVAHAKKTGRDVLVEGELGFIGSGSKILESIPEGAAITEDMMTAKEDAAMFVSETGVDLLAPAVGNIHGMLKGVPNPALSTERIALLREFAEVPLVLHGGSGISDDGFREAIRAGIRIIHVSTELRVLYRSALEESLKEQDEELAPYRLLAPVVASLTEHITGRMRLFSGT